MHIPFVVNRTFNTAPTERLQQHSSFYNKPHRSHIPFVKAALGTTFTSRSQHHFVMIGKPELSGICAKLHTVDFGSKQQ